MSSLLSLPGKFLGALTASPAVAAPASVPMAPTAPATPTSAGNTQAQDERDEAARAALVDQASAGRRSTIVAGASILDDQKGDLFAPAKRRAAARALTSTTG